MMQFRNEAFKYRTQDMVLMVDSHTMLLAQEEDRQKGALMMEPQGSLDVKAGRKDLCLEAVSRQHLSNISILNVETQKLHENKK